MAEPAETKAKVEKTAKDLADEKSQPKPKPTKPDQDKFDTELAVLEKDHAADKEKYKAAFTRLNEARNGKGSAANDRWNALLTEKKAIQARKNEKRNAKSGQREKYEAADAQLKSLIAEQKTARARLPYRSLAEVDAKIADLNRQVEKGDMRLVDEKKALNEVSNLNRQRKGFTGIDETENKIAAKKAENQELRKAFDDPEARELEAKFEAINKELDGLKAARDGDSKNLGALREAKDSLHEVQNASYKKMKAFQDSFFDNRRAYRAFEDEIYQQKREKQKAEKGAYEKERRKRVAEQKLEEAGQPAFLDQIITAEGLIRYFDPSAIVSDSDKGPSKFEASVQRTVNEDGMKGVKLMKKDQEDFFVGASSKKKGKGKKVATESTKFNLNVGVIEQFSKIGVEAPTNQAEVPSVIEKLKEKLDAWKKDQDKQTKENIAKAQKEIDRLEKEANEAATAPAVKGSNRRDAAKKATVEKAGLEGTVSAQTELEQEEDGVVDAASDLKKASIEDKEDGEAGKA